MCDIQSTTHGSNKPPMDILEVVSFTQYRRDKNVVTIDLQSLLCALLPTSDVSRTLTYSNHHFLSLFETRSFDTSFVRTISTSRWLREESVKSEEWTKRSRRLVGWRTYTWSLKNLPYTWQQIGGRRMAGKPARISRHIYTYTCQNCRRHCWRTISIQGRPNKDEVGGQNLVLANPKKKWNTKRKGMAGSNSSSKAV